MSTQLRAGARQTQAAFGMVRMLRDLQLQYPGSKKFVLWDGKALHRYELFPDYKKRRVEKPEQLRMRAEYKKQQPDIERALKALGIDQVRSPTCEADDLAAAYAFAFADKGWRVQLLSSDTDWHQLVNPLVSWQDPIRPDKTLTHDTFEAVTGFKNTRQIIDAKALTGDASDSIPGVGGIGKVGAKRLLDRFGRVTTFLAEYDKDHHALGPLPKNLVEFAENLDGRRNRFHRNFKLMELRPDAPGINQRVTNKGNFDSVEFAKLCEELAFISILNNFDSWMLPFRTKS